MSELSGASGDDSEDEGNGDNGADKAGGPGPHDTGSGRQPPDNPRGYPGDEYRGARYRRVSERVAAEDRLIPNRFDLWAAREPRTIGGSDRAAERDGDQAAPATEAGTDTDTGNTPASGAGDQDQAATQEAAPAAARPDEASGDATASVAERGLDDADSRQPSLPVLATDAGETVTAKATAETPQADEPHGSAEQGTLPDSGPATPDAAYLKALVAEFEATMEAKYAAKLEQQSATNEARSQEQDARYEARFQKQEARHQADLGELIAENRASLARQETKYEARLEAQNVKHETDIKSLKVTYEARVTELEAKVQALEGGRQAAPDVLDGQGVQADQPRSDGCELPEGRQDQKDTKFEGNKKGLLSNEKIQLYGAAGAMAGSVLLDLFVPGMARVAGDIIVNSPAVIAATVPVRREGWGKKHDDSHD